MVTVIILLVGCVTLFFLHCSKELIMMLITLVTESTSILIPTGWREQIDEESHFTS